MVVHYTVTLTGAAQRLSDILAPPYQALPMEPPVNVLIMQPGGANAGVCYVGGVGVTAANYGFVLPAAAAGVPPAPYNLTQGMTVTPLLKLKEIYVLGAAGEKLALFVIFGV
jgi:hypothetical protein